MGGLPAMPRAAAAPCIYIPTALLGGFGIVGGQIPIATGAAFYQIPRNKEEVAICFMGDGAIAQGAFHESLNMASLWNFPASMSSKTINGAWEPLSIGPFVCD